jgi:hypothetical protein
MSGLEEREIRQNKMHLDRIIEQSRRLPDYSTVRGRVESAKLARREAKLEKKRQRKAG